MLTFGQASRVSSIGLWWGQQARAFWAYVPHCMRRDLTGQDSPPHGQGVCNDKRSMCAALCVQGAELMGKFGINVPPGRSAKSLDEVASAADAMKDENNEV